MRGVVRTLAVVTCTLVLPAAAWAQASIAGTVKDPSGAVLPGVTVEAASPVLIEKIRTAVTDNSGLYRIEDLRPGTYSVTFTLPGFTTMRRDEVAVAGSAITNVSVELRVGGVQETVTVTGETPVVDIQSTRREVVVDNETIRSIPSVRSYRAMLLLVPGVQTDRNNVETGPLIAIAPIHGGRSLESRLHIDGLNVSNPPGGNQPPHYVADVGNAAEVNFVTSGGLGESETAGLIMNVVPKTGGNSLSGMVFASGFSEGMQADNWTPDLGIAEPVPLRKVYDFTVGLGGPIMRDRLWYFAGGTVKGQTRNTANLYENLNAGDPAAWTYSPDLSKPAYSDRTWEGANVRLTLQATPRNKFGFFWDEQAICRKCTGATSVSGSASATTSPEADGIGEFFPQRVQQVTWSSPMTNRLLFDAAIGTSFYQWGNAERPGNQTRDLIRVTESLGTTIRPDDPSTPANEAISVNNLTYRSQNWAHDQAGSVTWRGAMSFITGAHSVKVGYQGNWWKNDVRNYVNTQNLNYTLRAGVPSSFTMNVSPFETITRAAQTSLYAQEQWTLGRLTLQGALRYDRAWSWFPEQSNGPTRFLPVAITFAEAKGVDAWNDITPRMGAAWDVFGSGKTALKVNLGKYLDGASSSGTYAGPNPMTRLAGGSSTTRTWADNDRDFVVDCEFLNPIAQSPAATGSVDTCGALTNAFFGTNTITTQYDPDLLSGWGVRPSDWSLGISVQQQIFARASVDVGYFRRWFAGFQVTDNLALGPNDFDTFTVTIPSDARLPGGGGGLVANLFDARSLAVNNLVTTSRKYGDQYRQSDSVDVTVNIRATNGVTIQGGTSTSNLVQDSCEIRAALPETATRNPYCHTESGFLTQFRGLATYTIPRIDLLVSTVYQDKPGSPGIDASLNASYTVPQEAYFSSLGRLCTGCVQGGVLTGGAINLIEPGTLYGDRIRQVDLGIKKVLRLAGARTTLGVDLYNLLNSNVKLTYSNAFVPGGSWLTPTEIMNPRIVRLTGEFSW